MAPGMQDLGPVSRDHPRFRNFQPSTLYDGVQSVKVNVYGEEEEVWVDPEQGPVGFAHDGRPVFHRMTYDHTKPGDKRQAKRWREMSSTEQTIHIHTVAKKNIAARRLAGLEAAAPQPPWPAPAEQ
mmetsp:Transcript_23374/g.73638  ORF Transcript_23374/g.73638 Transcript_23374/m.73638 type:complete len:126 (+) Transcript_23374:71-448(+)